jgi:DNA-binding NtrC family response regulator
MNPVLLYQRKQRVVRDIKRESLPAVVNNKLEAMHVLAASLLSEVISLEKNADAVVRSRMDLSEEVHRFESDIIRCALVRTGGRLRQAANLLNIKPSTLHAKMKRYGLLGFRSEDLDDRTKAEA